MSINDEKNLKHNSRKQALFD
jgi:hypothetical protein